MTTTNDTLPTNFAQVIHQLPEQAIVLLAELGHAMAAGTVARPDLDATLRGERVPDDAPHAALLHRLLAHS